MPFIFGPGADLYWHGGSAAIYKQAQTATLVEVLKANHFAIAGTNGKQLEHLMYHLSKVNGLQFNLAGRPYRWVPTLEYTVAFLYEKLNIVCQPVAINSGYVWPKKGLKQSKKTITISILKPITNGLSKEDFIKTLENNIYSELNLLN